MNADIGQGFSRTDGATLPRHSLLLQFFYEHQELLHLPTLYSVVIDGNPLFFPVFISLGYEL